MHHPASYQPLRLGPGLWPTPTCHPGLLLVFVLVGTFVLLRATWLMLHPLVLADPRPEVARFVVAALTNAIDARERAALSAYRATLAPREQQALAHEVNYLLFRHGCPTRIDFDAEGRVAELAGTPARPAAGDRTDAHGPGASLPGLLERRFDPDHPPEGRA